MPMQGSVVEFREDRISNDDQLQSLGELSFRLVASQHRREIQMPTIATLSLGCDRVVVDTACGKRLEACLTPSTLVERRLAASSDSVDAWGVDLTATSGMTWSLRLECAREDEALFLEGRLRVAQQTIVASLHSVIVSSTGSSGQGDWYPSLDPLCGSQFDTRKGRFVLGGYAVLGYSKRWNHPALPQDCTFPESSRFRLTWGELRAHEKNGRVYVTCFFYPDHEHTSDGNLLDMIAFSSDAKSMEVRGNTLVFYGTGPRDGIRSPCEVPGDVYMSFRHILEARLWCDVSALCLAHDFANLGSSQQQRAGQWQQHASTLQELFGELAIAPSRSKEPMLAKVESRALVKDREPRSKPADSIAVIMDDVDRDNEEIREICIRRQKEELHITLADDDEWDGMSTVINR